MCNHAKPFPPGANYSTAPVVSARIRTMDSDEREIFNYLKTWGKEYVSVREICRRAGGKKRFHEDPDWAKVILPIMLERGILERDAVGRYRIKPKSKKGGHGRWVSPDIAKLLKEKGVTVEGASSEGTEIADDEHYEHL